jgi:hypothetical protein
MNETGLNDLKTFLGKANQAGYANENPNIEDFGNGDHKIVFEDDGWRFTDWWQGGNPFAGQEEIYRDGHVVWSMLYRGRALGSVLADEVFKFLRKALRAGAAGELRGPSELRDGDWLYQFAMEGDLTEFTAHEEIFHTGELVHDTHFFGGLVDVEREI